MKIRNLIGILMTGMGSDGALAMADLRSRGGKTIAEAQETAVVWGMPGELVRADGATWTLPLPRIAPKLLCATLPRRQSRRSRWLDCRFSVKVLPLTLC